MIEEIIQAIAAEHARDIEDQLTPDERAACLRGEAVFSDYMDEGASLEAAFKLIVGRAPWWPADIDEGSCSEGEMDADQQLITAAMEASNYMLN